MNEQIKIGLKSISKFEKVIGGLILFAFIARAIVNYYAALDISLWGMVLAITYFPVGFYTLGKPNINGGIIISILLGFVYSLGALTMISGVIKFPEHNFFIFTELFLLLLITFFILYKLKTEQYDRAYIYAQFIRISFLALINLVVILLF